MAADYTNLATRGLQEAMNTFSKSNADGILAASVLLSWLQNDWYVDLQYRDMIKLTPLKAKLGNDNV